MTTSGTSAIILALMALDLNKGDKVIVPNYTMIATINCIEHLGLQPIIVDVDPNTYTININHIKSKICSDTKAIIHVSLNNRYINLEELVLYCKNNNIFVHLVSCTSRRIVTKISGTNSFLFITSFTSSFPTIRIVLVTIS